MADYGAQAGPSIPHPRGMPEEINERIAILTDRLRSQVARLETRLNPLVGNKLAPEPPSSTVQAVPFSTMDHLNELDMAIDTLVRQNNRLDA